MQTRAAAWDTMRRMRPALLLCSFLLCLGCSRSVEPANRNGDAASSEQAGAPPTGSAEARPEPSGDAGPPAAGASECRTDADCALTMVPEGECCPMLCEGRPVPVAEAHRLDARQRECEERDGLCPLPPCAPPRTRPVPMCTAGRCAARQIPMEAP